MGDGKRLRANTLLEPRNPMQSLLSPESERRSVHDAAASNQRAAFEKARADRVQGELDESRMELDESRVKLKQQEEKSKLEREQRMAAQRAAAGAAAAAEKSENLRVAETAKINAAALEMMEGAVEDATAQLKKELLKVRQVLQKVEEAQGGQMREQAAQCRDGEGTGDPRVVRGRYQRSHEGRARRRGGAHAGGSSTGA